MSLATDTDFLTRVREQAAQRFEALGWPTPRLEEWKYTNLAPLEKRVAAGELVRTEVLEPADVAPFTLRGRALAELVFVNGIFDEASSDLGSSKGIRIAPLRRVDPASLERHLTRYADYQQRAMTAQNTALAQDGAYVEVDAAIEGYVHFLFIGTNGRQSFPRNLIVAGRGAQITVVETYTGSGTYFTNAVTEVVAGEGAVIDHTRVECESLEAFHIGTVQIHQERASSVAARSIAIGGALVRNETHVALSGEGASLVLDGLYLAAGAQHIDNKTVIGHVAPHCDSVELYKGILDGNARGIFDGKIVVHEGAKKTAARQTNRNLLLSGTAIVDSKPTLEISNDDVKCNHGSTIGQIDEEAMFYMRSRGLDEQEARGLLVLAFAGEIADRIKVEPVRERIRRAMFETMPHHVAERRAAWRPEGER